MTDIDSIEKPVYPINPDTVATAKELLRSNRPEGLDIAVFCSGTIPENPIYESHAYELGRIIGKRGHNLIWGGTQTGTMQVMSDAAKEYGAALVGVGYRQEGKVSSNADMVLGAESLEERKQTMFALGHTAIALAGGVGTLGEIAFALEEEKGKLPLLPVILVNSDGFYDNFADQIATMEKEGMLPVSADDMIRITNTPLEAVCLAEDIAA